VIVVKKSVKKRCKFSETHLFTCVPIYNEVERIFA